MSRGAKQVPYTLSTRNRGGSVLSCGEYGETYQMFIKVTHFGQSVAINYRSTPFDKTGGLGIYNATKALGSAASSSLDKKARTLTNKTAADLAWNGNQAQQLINSVPRTITPTYTVANRSYAMAAALQAADPFLQAQQSLTTKFISQGSAMQQQQLIQAAQDGSVGYQRAVVAQVQQQNDSSPAVAGFNPLLLLAGLAVAAAVLR